MACCLNGEHGHVDIDVHNIFSAQTCVSSKSIWSGPNQRARQAEWPVIGISEEDGNRIEQRQTERFTEHRIS